MIKINILVYKYSWIAQIKKKKVLHPEIDFDCMPLENSIWQILKF